MNIFFSLLISLKMNKSRRAVPLIKESKDEESIPDTLERFFFFLKNYFISNYPFLYNEMK